MDVDAAERLIHGKLSGYRVNPRREFFLVPLKLAVNAVFETCVQINADIYGKADARIALFIKKKHVTTSRMLQLSYRIRMAPKGSAGIYLILEFEDRSVTIKSNNIGISLNAAYLNSLREIPGVADVMIVHGKRSPSAVKRPTRGPQADT